MHTEINLTRREVFKSLATAAVASSAAGCAVTSGVSPAASGHGRRFYRGQFHTHTFWSDGRAFPEQSIDLYRRSGYDFLALTDHNRYADAERYLEADSVKKEILDAYRREFPEMVRTRIADGKEEVKLSTMAELRMRFEEPGRFLLIDGVEATRSTRTREGAAPGHRYVHMNYLNIPADLGEITGARADVKGMAVADVIRETCEAVETRAKASGRKPLFILNHPLWYWYDVQPEDLIANPEVRFFEVCNGGAVPPAAGPLAKTPFVGDRFWDVVNAFRARKGERLLYGIGDDDAHYYYGLPGEVPADHPHCLPLSAWNQVRAKELSAAAIIEAMEAGDFAACEGIGFEDIAFDPGTRTLSVAAKALRMSACTVEFIVSRKDFPDRPVKTVTVTSDVGWQGKVSREINLYDREKIGVTAKKVSGGINEDLACSYTMAADDLYVRARLTAPLRPLDFAPMHPQVLTAWTQPYSA